MCIHLPPEPQTALLGEDKVPVAVKGRYDKLDWHTFGITDKQ